MSHIDTHAHIAPCTDHAEIIASMDAAGVGHIAIMPRGGAEEAEVLDFFKAFPDRVIPFFGGSDIQTLFMQGGERIGKPGMTYFKGYRNDWWEEWLEEIMAYLESEMTSAPYRGIGELRLRHYGNGPGLPEKEHDYDFPTDSPFMLRLVDLAAKLGLPVAIHLEAETEGEVIQFTNAKAVRSTMPMLERLAAHNREATIIWAHLGRAAPDVLAGVLERNPNIYTDISDVFPYGHCGCGVSEGSLDVFREYTVKNCIVDTSGRLKPEWRPVFEQFADRIMMGTDAMSSKAYGNMYQALVHQIEDVLGEIDAAAAKMIAETNARAVFRL